MSELRGIVYMTKRRSRTGPCGMSQKRYGQKRNYFHI